MTDILQRLEQEPSRPARSTVIWMHGLGATAHDFESVPPELGLDDELAIRFVFPQAPSQPVTINGGMVMPAWYDILSLGGSRNQDEAGIRRTEQRVRDLIEHEIARGIPPEQIVVGGFSQGGAIALHTGLRYPRRLGGIMVLSAYLLLADELDEAATDANRDVPIFMAHGTHDPMVPHRAAVDSRDALERHGWSVEWHEYPMAHQVCLPEIQAIGAWMGRVLAVGEGGG